MSRVHEDAICIRTWDWSETSQTLSLFTRGHGVLRAIAKGSRRPNARFSGGVELLSRGGAELIIKQESGLCTLTSWDLTEIHPAIRRSIIAFRTGLYFADLIHHMITDHDPHPGLFDAFAHSLRVLDQPGPMPMILLRFQWACLSETGYRPQLEIDADSSRVRGAGDAVVFDPVRGVFGVAAQERGAAASGREADQERALPRAPGGVSNGQGWRVRPATLGVLRLIAAGSEEMGGGDERGGVEVSGGALADPAAGPDAVRRANRLLAAYIRFVLGREPSTMRVLFGDRLPR